MFKRFAQDSSAAAIVSLPIIVGLGVLRDTLNVIFSNVATDLSE
jgi:Flp pilus assembly pilin Flp